MKLVKSLVLALVLAIGFGFPLVLAQTGTSKLSWDQPGATVAEASAYVYTLKIDAAPAAIVPATCVLAGTVTSCATPIATFTSGTHTLTLTGTNGFGTASASLSGSAPMPAVNIKVVVTVTVP